MQRENRPGPIFSLPSDGFNLLIGSSKDQMDYVDQMQVMFDIIGTPDESKIEKISDEKARKYLRNLPRKRVKNLKRML